MATKTHTYKPGDPCGIELGTCLHCGRGEDDEHHGKTTPKRPGVEHLLAAVDAIHPSARCGADDDIDACCRYIQHLEAEAAAREQAEDERDEARTRCERLRELTVQGEADEQVTRGLLEAELTEARAEIERLKAERSARDKRLRAVYPTIADNERLHEMLGAVLRTQTAENGGYPVCPCCRDAPCETDCVAEVARALLKGDNDGE